MLISGAKAKEVTVMKIGRPTSKSGCTISSDSTKRVTNKL